MGGTLALIGGFVGLVGLAVMFSNRWSHGADPIGILLFSLFFLNGLYAVYLRVTGKERKSRSKGPFSGKSGKR